MIVSVRPPVPSINADAVWERAWRVSAPFAAVTPESAGTIEKGDSLEPEGEAIEVKINNCKLHSELNSFVLFASIRYLSKDICSFVDWIWLK